MCHSCNYNSGWIAVRWRRQLRIFPKLHLFSQCYKDLVSEPGLFRGSQVHMTSSSYTPISVHWDARSYFATETWGQDQSYWELKVCLYLCDQDIAKNPLPYLGPALPYYRCNILSVFSWAIPIILLGDTLHDYNWKLCQWSSSYNVWYCYGLVWCGFFAKGVAPVRSC